MLKGLGATVVSERAYPDHHAFTANDAEEILKLAEDGDAFPATTMKDWVRLKHSNAPTKVRELGERSIVVEVKLAAERNVENRFEALLTLLD